MKGFFLKIAWLVKQHIIMVMITISLLNLGVLLTLNDSTDKQQFQTNNSKNNKKVLNDNTTTNDSTNSEVDKKERPNKD